VWTTLLLLVEVREEEVLLADTTVAVVELVDLELALRLLFLLELLMPLLLVQAAQEFQMDEEVLDQILYLVVLLLTVAVVVGVMFLRTLV
jgi:hypothetical protein